MPRKKRIWYPGAIYHVISRGNRRAAIFREETDYIFFLNYLNKIKQKYPFKIHSMCLMTNHFHMLIETERIELWRIMQKVLSIYATEYNHKYHYSGHLFGGRYSAHIIENEKYLLDASRYIHLNPVKAKMVSNPEKYEYSSYPVYVNDGDSEEDYGQAAGLIYSMVDTERILGMFGDNKSFYREFVESRIESDDQDDDDDVLELEEA